MSAKETKEVERSCGNCSGHVLTMMGGKNASGEGCTRGHGDPLGTNESDTMTLCPDAFICGNWEEKKEE